MKWSYVVIGETPNLTPTLSSQESAAESGNVAPASGSSPHAGDACTSEERPTGSGAGVARRTKLGARPLLAVIRADWREHRYYLPFGALVALLTSIVVATYYAHMPASQPDPDTIAYVNAAHHIASYGQLVDAARLPGYPFFIALVFLLTGWGN
ncbi:MAG: hypothetical protein ABI068_06610, partial [Ktedonobacterales bacterium]